ASWVTPAPVKDAPLATLPPTVKFTVPARTCTVPLLSNSKLMNATPEPVDFLNVPALVILGEPALTAKIGLLWTSTVPPTWLFNVELLNDQVPAPVTVMVPVLVSVPARTSKLPAVKTVSRPMLLKVPLMVPADQLMGARELSMGRPAVTLPLLMFNWEPEARMVLPVPLWVPPVQVKMPETVKSPPPVKVPPDRMRLVAVEAA